MGNWGDRLGGVDLETSGVDVDTARIVAAHVAVLDPDGAVVTEWNWYTAGLPIVPVTAEIAQTVRTLLALGIPIAVDNAPLLLSILDRECRRQHLDSIDDPHPVIDPLVLDREVDPDRVGGRGLEATARHYGVGVEGNSSAVVVARLAQALARAFPEQLDVVPDELHERQVGWYAEQARRFEQHVRSARGDAQYSANGSWPITPAEDRSFEDTQPIPAPPLRPSATVPVFDFTEAIPLAIEAPQPAPFAPQSSPVAEARQVPGEEVVEFEAAPEPEVLEQFHEAQDAAGGSRGSLAEQLASQTPPGSVPASGSDAAPWLGYPPPTASPDTAVSPESPDSPDSPSSPSSPASPASPAEPDGEDPDVSVETGVPSLPDELAEVARSRRVHVAAAIITDEAGRGLVVRKRGNTAYMQAGGKIERGESALSALIRELDEELGLEVDVAQTEFLGSFEAPALNEEGATVRAEVFALTAAAGLRAGNEIEELRWLESVEEAESVELAPLTREVLLPLWAARRPTLL